MPPRSNCIAACGIDAGIRTDLSAAGRAKLPEEWQKYANPVASNSQLRFASVEISGCFFQILLGEFST